MATITITIPALEPHEAKYLVTMAINEWRRHRSRPDYVATRYASNGEAYRQRRAARLERELNALDDLSID